jgi:hypothetical protein
MTILLARPRETKGENCRFSGGICWSECQPALGGGHKGFCQLRSGGKMRGGQGDEKKVDLLAAAIVE